MNKGLLDMFTPDAPPALILNYLNHSPFEEYIELDVPNNRFRVIRHMEDKYVLPSADGKLCDLLRFAADHQIHPDDISSYMDFMDPDTIMVRLKESRISGLASMSFRFVSKSGSYRRVEQVLVSGSHFGIPEGTIYCYIYDIQNSTDQKKDQPRSHADPDPLIDDLTGLLRKKEYVRTAGVFLADDAFTWLMIAIDLEKFKLFNEWYGWDNGSRVLADVGSCLAVEAEQAGGLAGYMGNDDFLLLVPEGHTDVKDLYRRIHTIMGSYGVSVGFQPSFGISRSEGITNPSSVMSLIDQASMACENAQKDFKKRIRYFDKNMLRETELEYTLLSKFREAISHRRDITFFLQPQCRASTGRIVGAEALARWQKADGSFISPAEFVPMLESTGFITDLDRYIWESVASWIEEYTKKGGALIPISVNVSQIDLFTIDVPAYFTDLTDRHHLSRDAIKIEITESAAAEDTARVLKVVKDLRDAGFTVLMDDFGSGYSSLNMLHQIDTDIIKIDALFLHFDRKHDEKGIHILESIVNMTKTMGTPVIVEGVETKDTVDFLQGLGCRYMQGYYFYKPMPVKDFEQLISNPDILDLSGLTFKANEQLQLREFLDRSVYSDAMLNSILGPVAFYSLHDDMVDIIRFNEQFYEAVHINNFQDRLKDIGRYMPEEDSDLMLAALSRAMEDRLNGATEVLTFFLPTGNIVRFLIHFYYLRDRNGDLLFYGSARDVTDITLLQKNMDLITGVFSDCLIFLIDNEEHYYFEVIAQGIEALGMSKKELEKELNNQTFYDRVAREHRQMLLAQCMDVIKGIDFASYFSLYNKDDERIPLYMESDCVDDESSHVRAILKISLA